MLFVGVNWQFHTDSMQYSKAFHAQHHCLFGAAPDASRNQKGDGKVLKGKYLKYILHFVVLVGLIIAALKYIHGEEVLSALKSYNSSYAPALLALPTLYLSMKAWRFIQLMRPVSDAPGNVLFRGYVA